MEKLINIADYGFHMANSNWREKVHPSLKPHLEKQISETTKHKEAYSNAMDPSIA